MPWSGNTWWHESTPRKGVKIRKSAMSPKTCGNTGEIDVGVGTRGGGRAHPARGRSEERR
jgi:hypothetical protein